MGKHLYTRDCSLGSSHTLSLPRGARVLRVPSRTTKPVRARKHLDDPSSERPERRSGSVCCNHHQGHGLSIRMSVISQQGEPGFDLVVLDIPEFMGVVDPSDDAFTEEHQEMLHDM